MQSCITMLIGLHRALTMSRRSSILSPSRFCDRFFIRRAGTGDDARSGCSESTAGCGHELHGRPSLVPGVPLRPDRADGAGAGRSAPEAMREVPAGRRGPARDGRSTAGHAVARRSGLPRRERLVARDGGGHRGRFAHHRWPHAGSQPRHRSRRQAARASAVGAGDRPRAPRARHASLARWPSAAGWVTSPFSAQAGGPARYSYAGNARGAAGLRAAACRGGERARLSRSPAGPCAKSGRAPCRRTTLGEGSGRGRARIHRVALRCAGNRARPYAPCPVHVGRGDRAARRLPAVHPWPGPHRLLAPGGHDLLVTRRGPHDHPRERVSRARRPTRRALYGKGHPPEQVEAVEQLAGATDHTGERIVADRDRQGCLRPE